MRWKAFGKHIAIRLDEGEELMDALQRLHGEHALDGYVVVSGLGQLVDPLLAYYDPLERNYIKKRLPGVFELLSVSGDFALKDGGLVPHIHVVVSDKNMQVFGGHLVEAKVGATLELFLTYLGELKRVPRGGLSLLEF